MADDWDRFPDADGSSPAAAPTQAPVQSGGRQTVHGFFDENGILNIEIGGGHTVAIGTPQGRPGVDMGSAPPQNWAPPAPQVDQVAPEAAPPRERIEDRFGDLPAPQPNVPWGTPNVEAAAPDNRGVGLAGKALGAVGLDESGARGATPWGRAAENTARGSSIANVLNYAGESLNRLLGNYKPGDESDPYREQAPIDAMTVASTVGTGGALGGSRPAGAGVGMFIGRQQAETLAAAGRPGALGAMKLAEEMEANGASLGAIRDATNRYLEQNDPAIRGIWKPPEWRGGLQGRTAQPGFLAELSDHDLKLNKDILDPGIFSTGDVAKHPELYAADPKMKDLALSARDNPKGAASWAGYTHPDAAGEGERMLLGLQTPDLEKAFLHEAQHRQQRLAGLSGGSSPEREFNNLPPMPKEVLKVPAIRNLMNEVTVRAAEDPAFDASPAGRQMHDLLAKMILTEKWHVARMRYAKNSSEAMAELTAERHELTPEEGRRLYPDHMMMPPAKQQRFARGAEKAASDGNSEMSTPARDVVGRLNKIVDEAAADQRPLTPHEVSVLRDAARMIQKLRNEKTSPADAASVAERVSRLIAEAAPSHPNYRGLVKDEVSALRAAAQEIQRLRNEKAASNPRAATDDGGSLYPGLIFHHMAPARGLQYFPADQLGGLGKNGEGILHYQPAYGDGRWRVVSGMTPGALRRYLGPVLADDLLSAPLSRSPNAAVAMSHRLENLPKMRLGEFYEANKELGKKERQRQQLRRARDAEWDAADPSKIETDEMAKPAFTEELIARALGRVKGGQRFIDVAREMSISEPTLRKWYARALAGENPADIVPKARSSQRLSEEEIAQLSFQRSTNSGRPSESQPYGPKDRQNPKNNILDPDFDKTDLMSKPTRDEFVRKLFDHGADPNSILKLVNGQYPKEALTKAELKKLLGSFSPHIDPEKAAALNRRLEEHIQLLQSAARAKAREFWNEKKGNKTDEMHSGEEWEEDHWQDLANLGTAREVAASHRGSDSSQVRQGPVPRSALKMEADALEKAVSTFEDSLKGRPPEVVAKAIEAKFGFAVNPADLQSGKVWWRLGEQMRSEARGGLFEKWWTEPRMAELERLWKGTTLTGDEIGKTVSKLFGRNVTGYAVRRIASLNRDRFPPRPPRNMAAWTEGEERMLSVPHIRTLNSKAAADLLTELLGRKITDQAVDTKRRRLGIARITREDAVGARGVPLSNDDDSKRLTDAQDRMLLELVARQGSPFNGVGAAAAR